MNKNLSFVAGNLGFVFFSTWKKLSKFHALIYFLTTFFLGINYTEWLYCLFISCGKIAFIQVGLHDFFTIQDHGQVCRYATGLIAI